MKFKVILLTLVVGVLGCVHSLPPPVENLRSPASAKRRIDFSDPTAFFIPSANRRLAVADPAFADLRDLLRANPHTVDEALLGLRTRFPDYFKAYSLVYDSLSLQEGSLSAPRALVFGPKARMVISFNGAKSQRGYPTIETMSYEPPTGFVFREVFFLEEDPVPPETDDVTYEPSRPGDTYRISQPNPPKCMGCHGTDRVGPNWNPYFLWPGVYGSVDDQAFVHGESSFEEIFDLHGSDLEKQGLAAFEAAKARMPRYRHLDALQPNLGDAFCDPFDSGQRPKCRERVLGPNFYFTSLLSSLNADDISNRLLKNSQFWPWRYAAAAALTCFDEVVPEKSSGDTYFRRLDQEIARYLPPNVKGALDKRSGGIRAVTLSQLKDISELLEGNRARIADLAGKGNLAAKNLVPDSRVYVQELFAAAGAKGQALNFAASSTASTFEIAPALVEYLLKPIGADFSKWSLNQLRLPSFDEGLLGTKRTLAPLARKIHQSGKDSNPVWREVYQSRGNARNDLCLRLMKLSNEALR